MLISACLLGINCRFDGTNAFREDLIKRYSKEIFIPICPEQLGGLPTPRPKAEISSENVIDINNRDVTKEFKNGANEALKIAKLLNIKRAVLKEKSPSCGVNFVYKNGKLADGMGITARLLQENGIEIEGVD
ncbi:MAG: DUF523 domain-containing protein [Deltaproteobacteria bacterium]|nr:DUF523 domain-containing protein [Deltaproteobacteria bacterium]